MKSGLPHHVGQRMFTFGCGQSLANRWLGISAPSIARGRDWPLIPRTARIA
jgi:hypothetical protein